MIQSLLTQEQYDELSKVYNTYNPSKRKSEKSEIMIGADGQEVKSGPPPNYTNGDPLSAKEIKTINKRLNDALAKVRIRYDETGLMIINNFELTDYK